MKRLSFFTLLMPMSPPLLATDEVSSARLRLWPRLTLDDAIARARATSARLASFSALTRAASEGVRGAARGPTARAGPFRVLHAELERA